MLSVLRIIYSLGMFLRNRLQFILVAQNEPPVLSQVYRHVQSEYSNLHNSGLRSHNRGDSTVLWIFLCSLVRGS